MARGGDPVTVARHPERGSPDAVVTGLVAEVGAQLRLDAGDVASASRVARTIADLAGSVLVGPRHVDEALSFRNRRPGASRAA